MTEASTKPFRAVVFGATGAVGRELVAQLAASPKWASVTTIGRRPLDPPPAESSPGKIKQITVNMETFESDPQVTAALSGVDSVFAALGTTRAVAGSAEVFKKVDYEYVAAAGRAAKKAGVPHFGLVSAGGANPNLWANDWKPFHGLLYAKTKGLAEESIKGQNFSHVTIMRPGMIERGDLTRFGEKFGSYFMASVPASTIAGAMVSDAEKFAGGGVPAGDEKNSAAIASDSMSSPHISSNLQTLQPQNVRPFVPLIRQQRNGTVVTSRAAYDEAPGMREIDPLTSGRTGQSSSMATASTSNRSAVPISYRVSLFDAMKFYGPAPERINGRLAMAMFAIAAQNEHLTGATFYQQLTNPDWKLGVLAVVITYASMIPILKGVKDEDFFMFTVKAEKWNGRLAMLGWAGMLYLEEFYAHACFF